jgi:hypothetical protein
MIARDYVTWYSQSQSDLESLQTNWRYDELSESSQIGNHLAE